MMARSHDAELVSDTREEHVFVSINLLKKIVHIALTGRILDWD